MDQAIVISFILSVMTASTPLLLAATGELVTEKSGVLNLGVEGMMLVGAIVGFATTVHTGSALLGVVAALLAGMAMSLIFAILTLTFLANQVATGLALTIFGTGPQRAGRRVLCRHGGGAAAQDPVRAGWTGLSVADRGVRRRLVPAPQPSRAGAARGRRFARSPPMRSAIR